MDHTWLLDALVDLFEVRDDCSRVIVDDIARSDLAGDDIDRHNKRRVISANTNDLGSLCSLSAPCCQFEARITATSSDSLGGLSSKVWAGRIRFLRRQQQLGEAGILELQSERAR